MQSASLEMSGSAQSSRSTPQAQLDESLSILSEQAPVWSRLSVAERASLLRACVPRLLQVAPEWVAAACRAKGLRPDGPEASEEWLAGPMVTMRALRLYGRTLDEIQKHGRPVLPSGAVRTADDGRVEVQVMPGDAFDKALNAGFTGTVRMQAGLTAEQVLSRQASHYQQPAARRQPGVSLILGAGNVASIPPADALFKLLQEGKVCLIKLNPVNEYLGPFYERAFQPLVERGFLRFAYGGADVGSYLSYHPQIADVHITGSHRTHDLIVWGPPGPERERRKAAGDPLLKKEITSELGCVTPVMVAPAVYSPQELRFVAENIATQVVNNASFNCNAAKVLVLSEGFSQREALWTELRDILASLPPRRAYYPGARDRFEQLTAGRSQAQVLRIGRDGASSTGSTGELPWTILRGLDAATNDPLFTTEPFCSILSEVVLPAREPAEFIREAARFSNDKLWGTLSCSLIVHPSLEQQAEVRAALQSAVRELRYGAVGINHWPGVVYGSMVLPWGGHASATLTDVQSGIGFVHNTPMLEGIEKCVLRGPLVVSPKPPWFVTHKQAHKVGERLVRFEAAPSWLKIPGIALTAMRG
jgi:acyl-CoA reductase-like NAD-dependent aldehyde dehydrogenase